MSRRRPELRRPRAGALALVLALAGTAVTWLGLATPSGIPGPPPAMTLHPAPAAPPPATAAAVHRSAPVRLEIPAIKVRTAVVPVGLRPDRTLDVPPLRGDAPAGWYEQSPTPGETGASVIAGHVDSARDGPAVFYRLRLLRVGDAVIVHRADGGTVRFIVDSLGLYAKNAFPSARVYGARGYPGLNLVTCGGQFDRARGTYRSNLVVFAREAT